MENSEGSVTPQIIKAKVKTIYGTYIECSMISGQEREEDASGFLLLDILEVMGFDTP